MVCQSRSTLSAAKRRSVFTGLAQCLLLQLETLILRLGFGWSFEDDPEAPLAQACPNLTSLAMYCNAQYCKGLIPLIHALPQLTHFEGYRIDVAWLQQLSTEPHSLRLQTQMHTDVFTPEVIEALQRLPSLTQLGIQELEGVSDLRFLSSFPALAQFSVEVPPLSAQSIADGFVRPITSCKSITALALRGVLTTEHFTVILPSLPMLNSLYLTCNASLSSLECFPDAGPLLARSLTSLYLIHDTDCQIRSQDLELLRCLTRLTQLEMMSFNQQWLDAETLAALTQPSVWLPRLHTFVPPPPPFRMPRFDEDAPPSP